jgi:hypothetical protein
MSTILHTGLRSLLETVYGVARSERRIVIVIEDGKALEVRTEHEPTRIMPSYNEFVEQFVEKRFEPVTPSPFKSPTAADVPPFFQAPTSGEVKTALLDSTLPEAVQQLLDANPGATLSTVPVPNSITVSFKEEEEPPWSV